MTEIEAQLLAELRELRAHLQRKPSGRHGWLKRVIRGLEDDPQVQVRVHKWASVYWLINFPVVGVLYFGFSHLWVALGLLVNTFYSLYANFATDYGALSAAQASLHVREATEQAREGDAG